jgi:hypothetical protein
LEDIMKKALALILVLAFSLSLVVIPASAVDPDYDGFYVGEIADANPGDTILVPIMAQGDVSASAFKLTLIVDKNVLHITEDEDTQYDYQELKRFNYTCGFVASGFNMVFATANGVARAITGTLTYVQYTIDPDAPAGTYTITLNNNSGPQSVGIPVTSGSVTVLGSTTPEEVEVSESATADSSSLAANLYVKIPSADSADDYTITINGVETALNTLASDENGYKISTKAPAKNMVDEIAYSVKKNGTEVKAGTTSIAQYLTDLKTKAPAYAELADALLVYGASAQKYFNYETDNLVTDAEPTIDVSTLAAFDSAAFKAAQRADANIPVEYSAMNVTFLADTTFSIALRVKNGFTGDEALEWVNANVTFGGEAVTGTLQSGATYSFIIISKQNISLKDITANLELVVGTTSAQVSVANYIASAQINSTNENLKTLTRALYAASVAANNLG